MAVIETGVTNVKEIKISRKTTDGSVSYRTRVPMDTDERELALQNDCVGAIKASIANCTDKKEAEKIAKLILSASAMVHSSLERILREHGKKQNEPAS
jgi:hypothetical protein